LWFSQSLALTFAANNGWQIALLDWGGTMNGLVPAGAPGISNRFFAQSPAPHQALSWPRQAHMCDGSIAAFSLLCWRWELHGAANEWCLLALSGIGVTALKISALNGRAT
jgi:hypothetical protein